MSSITGLSRPTPSPIKPITRRSMEPLSIHQKRSPAHMFSGRGTEDNVQMHGDSASKLDRKQQKAAGVLQRQPPRRR